MSSALAAGVVYADRPNAGGELVDRTLSISSTGYVATAGSIEILNDALREFTLADGTIMPTSGPMMIPKRWPRRQISRMERKWRKNQGK